MIILKRLIKQVDEQSYNHLPINSAFNLFISDEKRKKEMKERKTRSFRRYFVYISNRPPDTLYTVAFHWCACKSGSANEYLSNVP